jgi:hypothetical protein
VEKQEKLKSENWKYNRPTNKIVERITVNKQFMIQCISTTNVIQMRVMKMIDTMKKMMNQELEQLKE